jgi:hypothetical protein
MRASPVVLLLFSVLIARPAWAQPPVLFPDSRLKAAVEEALWVTDPTPADMLGLTSLNADCLSIGDLTGLEYGTNLVELSLRFNLISDVSPLSGLTTLRSLALLSNRISDLTPLSTLVNLESLDLERNLITDVSPIGGLHNLRSLCFHRDFICDISPLTSLTHLDWLDLRENPLNDDAYTIYVPLIRANNPGVHLWCSPYFSGRLSLSSTIGGSILNPGEGEFTCLGGQIITLEARAEPGYRFVGFSGTLNTTENPVTFMVNLDHQIRANFVSLLDTIYVDDDSPNDPRPNDPCGSDPRENGTASHPFDRIEEGVEVAAPGATVLVRSGTYRECVDFLGKPITLLGIDPNDPRAAYPVLESTETDPVVRFVSREDRNSVLRGFVITAGRVRTDLAIFCAGSSPTIANCLVVGNRASSLTGAAIRCVNGNATFINCTIADNYASEQGAALSLVNSPITLVNSIFWGNTPRDILAEGGGRPSIHYSDVASERLVTSSVDADPLFARAGTWVDRYCEGVVVSPDDFDAVSIIGDYHLRSRTGRWDPQAAAWVRDSVTSPCIDAGDPASPVDQEPTPNGGIIDMGAYGGTGHASDSDASF